MIALAFVSILVIPPLLLIAGWREYGSVTAAKPSSAEMPAAPLPKAA
jgi:hypothetical protein